MPNSKGSPLTRIIISPLPAPLTCHRQPQASVYQPDPETVVLTARAGDDLFADPNTETLVMSASTFAFETTGDFQFSARVSVDFTEKYDSGVLVGYFNDAQWFKICAEIDPLGQKRIVTVVTNGRSDDANGAHLARDDIYLRITRSGPTFALHASDDGMRWDLARLFALNATGETALQLGIAAQSPAGNGTRVTFSEFEWKTVDLGDSRDGS
jgi:regulation of enolase protein 1 (concanavalin A-like superfamily)